jgi:hypothetical protein
MEGPVNQNPDFADRLAAAQDFDLVGVEEELSTVRARFLAAAAAPTEPANRVVWIGVPVVAVAAAAALMVMTSADPQLRATSQGVDVAVGDWISSVDGAVAIDFSDGTTITLEADSQARIVSIGAHGAHLLLERGHADLDVVHTDDADWSVAAGPFNVQVTGTHFGTEWSPEDQTLVIRMAHGSVVVTGPLLEGGQVVSDVGTLTVSLHDGLIQLTNGPIARVAVAPVVDEVAPEIEVEAPLRVERRVSVAPVAVQVTAIGSWKDLYARGKFKEAVVLAHELGVDEIIDRSSGDDLYLFGENARKARVYTLARRAFRSLRSSHAGTNRASDASFMLGKMAYDEGKDYRGAARWLSTHLDERPNGPTSEDAMYLLMSSYDKAGDRAAARVAAKKYLERFPKGKSAGTAKTLSKRR